MSAAVSTPAARPARSLNAQHTQSNTLTPAKVAAPAAAHPAAAARPAVNDQMVSGAAKDVERSRAAAVGAKGRAGAPALPAEAAKHAAAPKPGTAYMEAYNKLAAAENRASGLTTQRQELVTARDASVIEKKAARDEYETLKNAGETGSKLEAAKERYNDAALKGRQAEAGIRDIDQQLPIANQACSAARVEMQKAQKAYAAAGGK